MRVFVFVFSVLVTALSFSHAQNPQQRLAFTANSMQSFGKVYVVNSDGSGLVDLCKESVFNCGAPAWSADGKRVAFSGDTGGPPMNHFIVNADGSGLRQLGESEDHFVNGRLSPDKNQIAFHSYKENSFAIFLCNADGSNVKKLIDLTEQNLQYSAPEGIQWSPNGKAAAVGLIVADETLVSNEVFLFRPQGSLQRLTRDPKRRKTIVGLLDDSRVLYMVTGSDQGELRVADTSGSDRMLTQSYSFVDYANLSPNGENILFVSGSEIFVIKNDGSDAKQLTNFEKKDLRLKSVRWSMDGKQIAFVAGGLSGASQLYVMNADGSNARSVTANQLNVVDFVWAP